MRYTKVNLKLDYNSKVFMSMLRSALCILLLPLLIGIGLAAAFVYNMEKEAEGFRRVALSQLANEVNQEFWSAYQLINRIKNTELIADYAKSEKRNYWTEYQIHKYMSKVLVGSNLETAYLYFPQHEIVFSVTGGAESKYFHALNYDCSFEEWREALEGRWNGKSVQLPGKGGEYRNLIVSSVLNSGIQNPPAAIAVQLQNEYMSKMALNLQLEEGDKILVYNSNGMIGSSFDAEKDGELTKLLCGAEWKDKDTIRFGDITYEVMVRYSSQYGLTFVYAVPKDMMHASFAFIRVYSFGALFFCVVFSVGLCLAMTNRNYGPIKRLFGLFRETGEDGREAPDDYDKMERYISDCISRNRNLQSAVRRYEEDYRKVYLEKILYGKIRYLDSIEEGSRLYGLGLESPWFAVVAYEIAEMLEEGIPEEPFSDSVGVLKEFLGAYIKERMDYVTRFYIVEEHNGCVVVLNGEGADAGEFCAKIRRDNTNLLEEMERQKEICYEAYVSDGLEGLVHLHEGYGQVMHRRTEKVQEDVALEQMEQMEQEGCLQIDKVVELVRNQTTDPSLSVAGLAEQFNVSASHLSRFFKQQMGVGLLDYIHRCRVNEAKELMKNNPSIRVKEVADRTGFYNVSAFIRVFKKIENITPGQYREKM